MAYFKFSCVNAKTGQPLKAEIFLGGKSVGFTPDRKGQYLLAETNSSGKFEWYAKVWGKKIDSGYSSGGDVRVFYSG
jgi:hypothetical protein